MATHRWSPVTLVFLGVGVAFIAAKGIYRILGPESLLADVGGVGWYRYSILYAVAQLAVIRWWPVRRPVTLLRSDADLTWFVPVFIWGLESVYYVNRWPWEARFCFGPPGYWVIWHGLGSGLVMLCIVGACLVAEELARREGRAARRRQGTLPLPVVAVLFSVGANWALHGFVWFPRPY